MYPNFILYDESLPLEKQTQAVQEAANSFSKKNTPTRVEKEDCGGGHERATQEVWALETADLIRVYEYQNPPLHAACYALRGMILILRPRLI